LIDILFRQIRNLCSRLRKRESKAKTNQRILLEEKNERELLKKKSNYHFKIANRLIMKSLNCIEKQERPFHKLCKFRLSHLQVKTKMKSKTIVGEIPTIDFTLFLASIIPNPNRKV